MPTYEYICDNCSHFFEEFQNMTDVPIKECPECGSSVRRIISSGAGIIFKGKGFYQTDYKKNGCPASCKADNTGQNAAPCCNPDTSSCCEANA